MDARFAAPALVSSDRRKEAPSDAYGSGGGGVLALMLVPTLLATAVRTSGHS